MPLKTFNDGRSGFRFNWPERRLRMRSLYTADPAEAEKRANELRNGMKAEEFKRKYANAPKAPVNPSLSERMAKYRTEVPPIETPTTPEPSANATLDEVLSRVSEQRLGEGGPPLPQPSEPSSSAESDTIMDDANTEWDGADEPAERPKKTRNFKGLGRKIAGGLAQANMTLLALGVKVFGTNKKFKMEVAPASDESVAVTAEGIEMWIDETLVNHPPKWYHLWGAGNAMMLASIISQSERHERGKEPEGKTAGPPMPEGAAP